MLIVLLQCWKSIFLDLIVKNTVLNISPIASKKIMEIIVKLLLLSFKEMLIDGSNDGIGASKIVLNIILDFEHL